MSLSENYYRTLLHTVLETIEEGSVMVIGPLGVGTDAFESNVVRFEKAQKDLEEDGYTVFNQLPYLDIFLEDAPKDYGAKFDIFYKGIIQSGKITTLFVLPHYKHARGVLAEISYGQEKEIPVIFLSLC
jgi:hypothetical protein